MLLEYLIIITGANCYRLFQRLNVVFFNSDFMSHVFNTIPVAKNPLSIVLVKWKASVVQAKNVLLPI